MADSFGLKIGLEGEKEFKKALADINQSFKVLGSEMKLATSQFDKNDKSVEALAARNKALRKEIDEQTTKIDTLRKELQNAATSFGENDRRTQNWQIQLNNRCPPDLYSIHGGVDAGGHCKGTDSRWDSDSIEKTTLADQYSGKHPSKREIQGRCTPSEMLHGRFPHKKEEGQ